MNIRNLNNLSADAKQVLMFFYNSQNLNYIIRVNATFGSIFDPENLSHIQDIETILKELKNNGNISEYKKIKLNDGSMYFEFI